MRIAYIDCFSGVSGDKLLAALLDCDELVDAVNKNLGLIVEDLAVAVDEVSKNGIRAKKLNVLPPTSHSIDNWDDLILSVEQSTIAENIKSKSLEILNKLAQAESKVHGAPVDELHLHEIGGWDTVADIVGCVTALEFLNIDAVFTSRIAVGSGTIETEHGILPIPAPATAILLKNIPVYEGLEGAELTTPTGAAIISTIADKFISGLPPMTVDKIGLGAGMKDLTLPNITRVLLGNASMSELKFDKMLHFSANIDDMNPEFFPYVIERLLDTGAADAWTVPVSMKKGRQGFELCALAQEEHKQNVLQTFIKETTTLGVRITEIKRQCIERQFLKVKVSGLPISVKIGIYEGLPINIAPEYEDVRQAAKVTGLPLKHIYQQAVTAATEQLNI